MEQILCNQSTYSLFYLFAVTVTKKEKKMNYDTKKPICTQLHGMFYIVAHLCCLIIEVDNVFASFTYALHLSGKNN